MDSCAGSRTPGAVRVNRAGATALLIMTGRSSSMSELLTLLSQVLSGESHIAKPVKMPYQLVDSIEKFTTMIV